MNNVTEKETLKVPQRAESTFFTQELVENYYSVKEDSQKSLVSDWLLKRAAGEVSVKYTASNVDDRTFGLKEVFNNDNNDGLSELQKSQLRSASLAKATGSISTEFSSMLLAQTNAAFIKKGGNGDGLPVKTIAEKANALIGAFSALAPQDEIEATIISKILVLNDQTMHFLAKCADTDNLMALEKYNNIVTKLIRLGNELVDTLGKHRRRGIQHINVQHINVSNGQTIIKQG